MTTRNRPKTEEIERISEQAFQEGYEAGFRAAREKYGLTKEPLPEAALEYARRVYRLDGVERVYVRVNKVLYIRTKVRDTFDDALIRPIFEIEGQMYDAFPDHGYEIDFHLIDDQALRSEDSLERDGFDLIHKETPVAAG